MDVYKAFQWSSGISFANMRSFFFASCGWVERVECSVVRDKSFLSSSTHGSRFLGPIYKLEKHGQEVGMRCLVLVYGRASSLVSYLISHDSQLVCTVPVSQPAGPSPSVLITLSSRTGLHGRLEFDAYLFSRRLPCFSQPTWTR